MQDGADIDNVELGTRATERQDGFFQPVIQLVALFRAAHLLVVFDIIQHHQIRAVRAVAQTAQLFTAARHLHLDIVVCDNGSGLPDTATTCNFGEIHVNAGVKRQLGLDGFQHRVSLINVVHHDDQVMLEATDDAPQLEQLTDQR